MTTTSPTFDAPLDGTEALTGSAVGAALRVTLTAVTVAVSASVSVAGLYLAKSALGINLLPWNSPLHNVLYHFVR